MARRSRGTSTSQKVVIALARRAVAGALAHWSWPALLVAFLVAVVSMVLILGKVKSEAAARALCDPVAVSAPAGDPSMSPRARREIPRDLVPIYVAAAGRYRLGADGWSYLAAVNEIETDFGRNLSTSSAGAVGWMQFMPSTWAQYGVDADHNGTADPNDPDDAIFSAARYLRAGGAPSSWHDGLFAYNHAEWYVQDATDLAAAYRGDGASAPASPVSAVSDPGACSCTAPAQAAEQQGIPNAHGGIGFTPAPGKDFSTGREPEIARRLDALGKALRIRLTGISGRRTPEDNARVDGSPTSKHLTGDAADVAGVETVPERVLRQYGLTRPMPGTWTSPTGQVHDERNHMELAPGSGPPAGAGSEPGASAAEDCGPAAELQPGARATLTHGGKATVPEQAPEEVQTMLVAGNRLVGQPYHYGGGHGSTLDRLSDEGYDCSAAVSYVLHAAGRLGSSAWDSTALATYGDPGPGTWVTIYANQGHAFMVVAGVRFDTSKLGDHGPAGGLDGPRWRTWPRAHSGFTVRHPRGL